MRPDNTRVKTAGAYDAGRVFEFLDGPHGRPTIRPTLSDFPERPDYLQSLSRLSDMRQFPGSLRMSSPLFLTHTDGFCKDSRSIRF